MTLNRRFLLKHAITIPAFYFLLVGLYDMVMGIRTHNIGWRSITYNLLMFTPVVFRSKVVYILSGALLTCCWGMQFLGLLFWFYKFLTGSHFRNPATTFGAGFLFLSVSLACSLYMLISATNAGKKFLYTYQ